MLSLVPRTILLCMLRRPSFEMLVTTRSTRVAFLLVVEVDCHWLTIVAESVGVDEIRLKIRSQSQNTMKIVSLTTDSTALAEKLRGVALIAIRHIARFLLDS